MATDFEAIKMEIDTEWIRIECCHVQFPTWQSDYGDSYGNVIFNRLRRKKSKKIEVIE